tara:strand:+ start:2125 stop:3072 length:948 start_codon:yes stop_codon:yes gene_type:complete
MGDFAGTNNTTNMDGSSMSGEQKVEFAQKHPILLGEKHETTVKNLKDLQDVEKYMFNNLQSLNKSSPDSIQESQMIKSRLDELSTTRMSLFKQLTTMYKDQQRQTSDSRGNLADQLTMTKVVSNELDNAKKELISLEQERLNKKRLVELGEYEYDRYRSHKNIMKVVVYGALTVLLFVILMRQDWFPSYIGVISISLIICLVLITISGRMLNNFSRTNLFWDKFDWSGVPGGGSSNKGNKKSFSWGSLFSDTCKNIETSVTGAKNSLLNVKENARAAGKLNVDVMNAVDSYTTPETFGNIVRPLEPARFETFQSV